MAVLVYTENWDGRFKKLSFELVSYASKLAGMLNMKTIAVSIGNVAEDELLNLGQYGAEKVLSIEPQSSATFDDQVYTRILAEVVKATGAELVVLSNNNTGKALGSRLSIRLKAALGSGMISLPVSTQPFVVRKKVFTGKAFARVELKTPIKILTLSQNSFEVISTPVATVIEKFVPETTVENGKVLSKDVQRQTGKIILTDADIVVSGGRGMKSPDNWGAIEELANLLGAATACSRPVSDDGWRPHHEHTGQTGKIIAPNLYIAAGISGAIQHMAGISSAKYIVAINPDKDAPIFESANYGIVGDAMKVLPDLIQAVKKVK